MFDLPVLQLSAKARTGFGQWTGEGIATFGLVLTILGTVRFRRDWVPASVALYITAAYWFTSSTSFANPAITRRPQPVRHVRRLIAPQDAPSFIAAQLLGAAAGALAARFLRRTLAARRDRRAPIGVQPPSGFRPAGSRSRRTRIRRSSARRTSATGRSLGRGWSPEHGTAGCNPVPSAWNETSVRSSRPASSAPGASLPSAPQRLPRSGTALAPARLFR